MFDKLKDKIKESLMSVLPITIIVLIICFTLTPMSNDMLMLFILGAILLIFGMGFFSLGADMAMSEIGERIGANLFKTRKLWLIALVTFIFGSVITVAEPDLQVLAAQIVDVPIILSVAIGVGIFLIISVFRIIFGIKLKYILVFFYALAFILAIFVPETILPIAFDSGGVTTGPITVPFIMALGIGATMIRSNKESESDSFGLIAMCSIGPVITVMILGLICNIQGISYNEIIIPVVENSRSLAMTFGVALPTYMKEVALALSPVAIFFVLYQIFILKLSKEEVLKIFVGIAYTFIGLTLFLTGANTGFMPVGYHLGIELANLNNVWMLIGIAMAIGYFIIRVEPAVIILTKQINDITDGEISKKLMMLSLAIGTMVALALTIIRIIFEVPIIYILLPGYIISFVLVFIVPEIFVGIAFDSGGVAVGTMASTFILPLAIGVCTAVDGNVILDAFGNIAIIAMMPTIVIQIMGLIYKMKTKNKKDNTVEMNEDDIIEFAREV